jgi:hypothetical protein
MRERVGATGNRNRASSCEPGRTTPARRRKAILIIFIFLIIPTVLPSFLRRELVPKKWTHKERSCSRL